MNVSEGGTIMLRWCSGSEQTQVVHIIILIVIRVLHIYTKRDVIFSPNTTTMCSTWDRDTRGPKKQ